MLRLRRDGKEPQPGEKGKEMMKGRKTGQLRLQAVKKTKKAKEAKEEREVRDQEAHVGHAEDPISRGSARKHLKGRGRLQFQQHGHHGDQGRVRANGSPMGIVDAEAHHRTKGKAQKETEKAQVQQARGRWMRAWGT